MAYTDRYYLTPDEAQELMPVENVDDARYDTIGICEICGKDFDKKKHTQKYCSPECRAEVKKRYDREYDQRPERKERRRERIEIRKSSQDYSEDMAFLSEYPALNLLSAIAYQAHLDGDIEARDDLLDMIRRLPHG